jgi:hypothetical protein
VRLVETAIAAAIIAIAAGGALYAIGNFGKYLAQQSGPRHAAALVLAQQTLRVAQDAWKYGSPGGAPSGTQSLALPGSVTTSVSPSGSSAQITVTVQYTPDPAHRSDPGTVTIQGRADTKAPLPGSQIVRPGLIPLPTGAP